MKICVFGASSARIDKSYIDAVERMGEKMARRGHSLVFGAGCAGLMGAAARGFKRGGGRIHGIIPEFFRRDKIEEIFAGCDEITYTGTMAERKYLMEEDADAFVVTPGGIGTFEEFYEVLTLKQLGQHTKAIAVFNFAGYFDDLESFMGGAVEKKFMTEDCRELYRVSGDADEILEYLETYVPGEPDTKKFKD